MQQPVDAPAIDEKLVNQLVASQFPHWSSLTVTPVQPAGWDNATFRLGDRMVVRLPRSKEYAPQVEKEFVWLPILAPSLPQRIPEPRALGSPTDRYPYQWSIRKWIDGEPPMRERISNDREFATSVAAFLAALQQIDPTGGPSPGPHNFYRGGSLQVYDAEASRAFEVLRQQIDAGRARDLWTEALATTWNRSPVWVHGDMSPGNLLLSDGYLSAVIDFGMVGIGDPACDLAVAWTTLDKRGREAFREALAVDDGTWLRGRAWALWKGAICCGRSGANQRRGNRQFLAGAR